jgi:DNA-binding NarL/FixJ family response regulator
LFIVEDSPDIADALSDLLSLDGTCRTVGQAQNEASAIAWSFHNEAGYDVAIVDLLLREGSGVAVVAHLAKYQPGKVIVLSEFATAAVAERCKSLGATAVFPKSQTTECITFVRSLAAGPAPPRESP